MRLTKFLLENSASLARNLVGQLRSEVVHLFVVEFMVLGGIQCLDGLRNHRCNSPPHQQPYHFFKVLYICTNFIALISLHVFFSTSD